MRGKNGLVRGAQGPRTLVMVFVLAALVDCSGNTSTPTATVMPSAASPSSSAKATVTATIDGLSALPHRVHWEANPSVAAADVREVDFLIDSQLAWTEKKAPYFYGDDGNWLVTSFLKPGRHQFETRLVTAEGQTVSDTVEASVGQATAPPKALSGSWARIVSTADLSKESPEGGPPAGQWTLKITDVGWVDGDPEGGGGEHDVAYVTPGRVETATDNRAPGVPELEQWRLVSRARP